MINQLLKRKNLSFERSYAARPEIVWRAWTEPDAIREWWGPKHTTIPECAIDLRVGGGLYIVMEAGEGMGKYRGTRWPLAGTFTAIEEHTRLAYDARSWTEGEEDTTTIHHVNELTLTEANGATVVNLRITITDIGSGAKMAAFGMKWGYKQYLDKLDGYLTRAR